MVGRGSKAEAEREQEERLCRVLNTHLDNVHETLQVLSQTPSSRFSERVSWEEVVKMGDRVSKQATIVGMLWVGGRPEAKAIEENMASYFNELQGFLLVTHGSMVGAGPTLLSTIHESVKKVVDGSYRLMKESVHSYGSCSDSSKELSIPVLVGTVWEVCSALKKTPGTNITVIGRALTQIAVTMKDVLREMKELKPACSDLAIEASDGNLTRDESEIPNEDDDASEGDIGNDLSPEEMAVAKAAADVVSDTLLVIKELIRCITGMLKIESSSSCDKFVDSLEKLLKLCQEIGLQIDELGACLYPPQEVPAILVASGKMSGNLQDLQDELRRIGGASDAFLESCDRLRSELQHLECELGCSQTDAIQQQLQIVSLSSPQNGEGR